MVLDNPVCKYKTTSIERTDGRHSMASCVVYDPGPCKSFKAHTERGRDVP